MFRTALAAVAAVGTVAVAGSTAPADAQALKGKTIEMIVPAGAGGGLTRNARRFAQFFGEYIPGNPKVIVKNIVGGGGQRGINFVYERGNKDGTTLLWGPLNYSGIVTGLRGIKYDPAKFSVVGTTGGVPFVTIASSALGNGIKSRDDLMAQPKFNAGGRIPGGALDVYTVMGFGLLGKATTHITGYRNQPKLKAALMRKEIVAATTGAPGYYAFYKNDLLKKGTAHALYYHPAIGADGKFIPAPDLDKSGVPTLAAYYKKVKGSDPSGDKWEAYRWYATYNGWSNWVVGPPGLSAEVVADLRKGYAATWNDPRVIDGFVKAWGMRGTTLVGDDTGFIIKNYKKISPAALAYLKQVLGTSDAKAKAEPKKKK